MPRALLGVPGLTQLRAGSWGPSPLPEAVAAVAEGSDGTPPDPSVALQATTPARARMARGCVATWRMTSPGGAADVPHPRAHRGRNRHPHASKKHAAFRAVRACKRRHAGQRLGVGDRLMISPIAPSDPTTQ